MRIMLQNTLLVCIFLIALLGCTTTTKTDISPESKKQAAAINTQLGVGYLSQGNLELADEKLRRALTQDPSSATTHWVFALLQARLGENQLAEKHFQKAISLDSKDSRAHNNYGTFLCGQGRILEAEKEFLLAISNPLYPEADSAYANAGICMLKIPDHKKAEEYFHKSLQINSAQRSALYQMTRLSFKQQDYEQTINYIQRYERVAKHNSESLWIAYQSAAKLDYKAKANDYADQLKKQYPSSQEAKLLAETYWHAESRK